MKTKVNAKKHNLGYEKSTLLNSEYLGSAITSDW